MLTLSDSPRWTQCGASAAPAPADTPPTQHSELGVESRTIRWAIDAMLYGDGPVEDKELIGKHGATKELVAAARDYADRLIDQGNLVRPRPVLNMGTQIDGRMEADVIECLDGLLIVRFAWGFKPVEPAEDPRLYLPALALRHTGGRMVAAVYQPRIYHPAGRFRHHVFEPGELDALYGQVVEQLGEIASGKPLAVPGEHCSQCVHRGRCWALQHNAAALFETIKCEPVNYHLTGPELSAELDFLRRAKSMVEARLTAVEAEAEARIMDGQWVPWYVLRRSSGKAYLDLHPDAAKLVHVDGVPATKVVVKSPNEMKKAGAGKEKIKALTKHHPGTVQLHKLTKTAIKGLFNK